MSINTQELFDQKAIKFSTGAESDAFTTAFFYAITRVIGDLNSTRVGSGLGIDTVPDDFNTDIDCDAQYFGVVSAGVDLYLKDTGEWGQQTRQEAESIYAIQLGRAQALAMPDRPPKPRNQDA